jgi:excisionase family DNA binding protein
MRSEEREHRHRGGQEQARREANERLAEVARQRREQEERRGAYSIKSFCEAYEVGHDKVYEEIRTGRLRAKKMGRRTLIPVAEAERWLESLPELRTGKAA